MLTVGAETSTALPEQVSFTHLRMHSELQTTGMKLEFSSCDPWPSSSDSSRPLIIMQASFSLAVGGRGGIEVLAIQTAGMSNQLLRR